MPEKTSFIEVSHEPRSRERLRKIQALLAGAVLMTGCNFNQDTASSELPSETASEGSIAGFESIEGNCNSSTSGTQEELTERAEDCLEEYGDADIALINFGLPDEDADKLAADTAEHIETTTGGMIQADIAVIPASQEAVDIFEAQIAEAGCVDSGDLEQAASYVADAAMPELAEYGTVAGVTNAEACKETVGGVYGLNHRHVDVFRAADAIAEVNANGGEYEVPVEVNGLTGTRYLWNVPVNLAHEILHRFNLGHHGYIHGDNLNDYLGQPIDVSRYIQEARYEEYGDDNVMGSPFQLGPDATLTPSQMYILEWPQRQLEQETSINAFDLAEQAVVFSGEDAASNIAILELPLEPIEGFNRIIFEPQLSNGGRVNGVDIILANAYFNNFAVLGNGLYEEGTHQLAFGDGVVTVKVGSDAVSVSYEA